MPPIYPRYSLIKVMDSRKTTSDFRAFRFSAIVVRHAVIALLVSLGAYSLLEIHRASATVVGDAAKARRRGKSRGIGARGILPTLIARRCKSRWTGIIRTGRRSHWP
jgi:hypothetical protein